MNKDPERSTRHHILFPRAEWELRPVSRKLRRTPSLIADISRKDHDYLHDEVPIVPALGHHTLMNITPRLWTPSGNTFQDIDSLCIAIDRASAPDRVHHLERDLAGLAIEALMIQKQVLREVWVG